WRPPGETRLRPVPWVARALLCLHEGEEVRFLLRGCLVCAPLAKEVLSRCFDLEARERTLCWAERGELPLPREITDRYQKFMEAVPATEYRFYPAGCPAAPTDAWPFATFGELLVNLGHSRQRWPHRYELRDLRNALAHGHYVGWYAVQALRRVEQQA